MRLEANLEKLMYVSEQEAAEEKVSQKGLGSYPAAGRPLTVTASQRLQSLEEECGSSSGVW